MSVSKMRYTNKHPFGSTHPQPPYRRGKSAQLTFRPPSTTPPAAKHFCSLLFRSPVAWLTIGRAAVIGSRARNFSSPSIYHTLPLMVARWSSSKSLVVVSCELRSGNSISQIGRLRLHIRRSVRVLLVASWPCWCIGKRMCRRPSPSALSSWHIASRSI